MPESKKPAPKSAFKPKYSETQKRKALKLYVDVGPREASRKLKIPESTLRKWARHEGLAPPTEHINAGVRGQQAHMAQRRAALAERLLTDAERLRELVWGPCNVYNLGGKDNTFSEATAKAPSARDRKELMLALGIALTKHVELVKFDSDGGMGLPAVDAWIQAMKGKP